MKRYPAILSALYNQPHCIMRRKLEEIEQLVLAHARGEARDPDYAAPEPFVPLLYDPDGAEFAADQVPAAQQARQFVAVLPLFGTLFQHGGMEMDFSGGTSTDAFATEVRRLNANPNVKTIIINAHTPGGQAWGTEEASNAVYEARQSAKTRIVTVVNSQMASAGVWIGTAAEEVYITPGGEAGSIGVLMIHQDFSKAEERVGVKTTLLAIPEKKIQGNEFEPLSDDARKDWLEGIQHSYGRFVKSVARNRNVAEKKVIDDFGGGGMLRADDAVSVGMADGIATLHEVIQREVAALKMDGRQSRRNQAAIARAAG